MHYLQCLIRGYPRRGAALHALVGDGNRTHERRRRHSHAGAWERGWTAVYRPRLQMLGKQSLCVRMRERYASPTMSGMRLSPLVPTSERGNEVVRLWVIHRGRPWGCRDPRGAWLPIAIGRGSVGTRSCGCYTQRSPWGCRVPRGAWWAKAIGRGSAMHFIMAGMRLSLLVPTLRRGNAVFDAPRRHLE
jgi:hypothetical protein